MKSLYDSVLSGIVSHIDKQINLYQDQKQAAVDALEAEKEAALAAYDAQIEAIDAQIKAKNKQISAIQKEIDAINKAAEARERDLKLQKDLYELERLRNQRTQFVLKNGQMVYQTDASAERDQREQVAEDEREIQVAELQKQIDLIQDQIDLLEEEKEAIQAMRDETEKYYDQLIKDTEAYWDALIKALEDYKSRWEELQELQDEAQFRANLASLGLDLDDILNMSEDAFAQFKSDYVGILADMYDGNEAMTNALSETLGMSSEQMGSYLQSTAGQTQLMVQAISNLNGPLDSLSNSLQAVQTVLAQGFKFEIDESGFAKLSSLGEDAGKAAESIPEGIAQTLDADTTAQDAAKGLGERTVGEDGSSGFGEGIEKGSPSESTMRATEAIPEGVVEVLDKDDTAESAAESFGQRIIDKLKETLEAKLGESNLDLTKLFPENFDITNVVNQFALLADAIRKVSDALGIGEEGATNGIAQAIADIGAMTLGAIATEDAAGEGIIGQFGALKDAVQAVTQAIGAVAEEGAESAGEGEATGTLISAIQALKDAADTYIGVGGGEEEGGGEESEEGSDTVIGDFEALKQAITENINTIGNEESEESDGTLIGNMMYLPTIAEETIPEVIGLFEELLAMIQECASQCASLAEEISGLAGTSISIGGHSSGSSTPIPSKRYQGTAHAQGSWGLQRGETALVGELGRELVVTKNGNYYTVGDKGAEFAKLGKGDIVFNHLQTEEILKKGHINSRGKAFAGGNADGINPFEQFYRLQDAIMDNTSILTTVQSNLRSIVKDMEMPNNLMNGGSNPVNISFGDMNFTCTGITAPEVMGQVKDSLERAFEGMAINAYQRAMVH